MKSNAPDSDALQAADLAAGTARLLVCFCLVSVVLVAAVG